MQEMLSFDLNINKCLVDYNGNQNEKLKLKTLLGVLLELNKVAGNEDKTIRHFVISKKKMVY